MAAVAQAPVPRSPIRVEPPAEGHRVLLHNVSWASYVAIGNALPDHPGLRMTFDRGNLEIMTTSPLHEIYKKRLGRLVETLAEEFGHAIATAGNMTFQREDLDRGLEGDDCFWIAHEREMRGKKTWEPDEDPPPDLILEIEISRSALNRMAMYAALKVPEVWCFDGTSLRVYLLQADHTYRRADRSPTFPTVPLEGIVPFLELSEATDFLGMVRAFREWLRGLPRE
jgi:Uma2 family endonuclease